MAPSFAGECEVVSLSGIDVGVRSALIALVAALSLGACTHTPGSSLLVRIYNDQPQAAALWISTSTGDDGSRSGAAPACSEAGLGFHPGHIQITVTSATNSHTFVEDLSDIAVIYDGIVVHADGSIELVYRHGPGDSFPPNDLGPCASLGP